MQDIAFMLLNAGAYTNLQDRYGDTNLIYACKFFDHTTQVLLFSILTL